MGTNIKDNLLFLVMTIQTAGSVQLEDFNLSVGNSESFSVSDVENLSQMIFGGQKKILSNESGLKKKVRTRKRDSFLLAMSSFDSANFTKSKTKKTRKRDSFLVAMGSIDMPGSSFSKSKRNSFIIASDILGFGKHNETFDEPNQEKNNEPVFYDTSRRSSVYESEKMPKRDSFLVIMDSLDLPKLGSKQKRVSQVFLSELLDLDGKSDFNKKVLQTSTKDPFLVSKNSSKRIPLSSRINL